MTSTPLRWPALLLALLLASCGDDAAPAGPTVEDQQVSAWLKELSADDASVRARAAAALGDAWPDGARSVPVLAEALDDDDHEVRAAAAASLEKLAGRGAIAIVAFLRDEEDSDRYRLLQAISEIQRLGGKVTPSNLAELIRYFPRGGMVGLGLGIGHLHRWLPANTVNRSELWALASCAAADAARILDIEDPGFTDTAAATCAFAGALVLEGSATQPISKEILALQADEEPALAALGGIMVRVLKFDRRVSEEWEQASATVMGYEALVAGLRKYPDDLMEGPGPDEATLLEHALYREAPAFDPPRRRQLAAAILDAAKRTDGGAPRDLLAVLGLLGGDAAVAVPWLLERLEDAQERWRKVIEPANGDVVSLMIDSGARWMSAVASRLMLIDTLGRIGPPAGDAVPRLQQMVAGSDPALRYLAARALRRIRDR